MIVVVTTVNNNNNNNNNNIEYIVVESTKKQVNSYKDRADVAENGSNCAQKISKKNAAK